MPPTPTPGAAGLRGLIASPPAERTEALKLLAADRDELGRQSASGLLLLAMLLRNAGENDLAIAVSHAAWRQSPGDFWVNWMIGMSSWTPNRGLTRPDEALRFLTAAVAIRPDNNRAYFNIGQALHILKDDTGALPCSAT